MKLYNEKFFRTLPQITKSFHYHSPRSQLIRFDPVGLLLLSMENPTSNCLEIKSTSKKGMARGKNTKSRCERNEPHPSREILGLRCRTDYNGVPIRRRSEGCISLRNEWNTGKYILRWSRGEM